ncbi:MAG: Release factor glutamine methyltransferase [Chlamydiales bacterium]|nr:Release factor glutamine methyltransferase [Chlamydiales bacterium]
MITLFELIQRSEIYLKERGILRARREAEEVIADVLGIKRLDLYLQFDRPLQQDELPALRSAVQRRSKHEPVAYIAGEVRFADLCLQVTPDVLIPRPETEILVEIIKTQLSELDLENKVLWDVCCGSGCMGISLKNYFPVLDVVLSDASKKALMIARKNAACDVTFKEGDLFEPFEGMRCDFFVCNPPYVSEQEYSTLEPSVRDWEPKMALVSGESGLEFYSRIAKNLHLYLRPEGLAWLEIGQGQGESVKKIFELEGWRCHYQTDWSGNDRFFFIEKL